MHAICRLQNVGAQPPPADVDTGLVGALTKHLAALTKLNLYADGEPLPADLDTGGGHDGFAGSRY